MRIVLAIFILYTSSAFAQKNKLKIDFAIKDTTRTIKTDVVKFYISDLKVVYLDGVEQKATEDHYLINFEEKETTSIEIEALKGKIIKGLDLCIGTDSLVNVSGAFDGALDPIHGMYWTWNSGYINIKLEGSYSDRPYEYHIGGFSGEHRTLRRKFLHQPNGKARKIIIELDLNHFFSTTSSEDKMTVMLPGAKASRLATRFIECIDIAK